MWFSCLIWKNSITHVLTYPYKKSCKTGFQAGKSGSTRGNSPLLRSKLPLVLTQNCEQKHRPWGKKLWKWQKLPLWHVTCLFPSLLGFKSIIPRDTIYSHKLVMFYNPHQIQYFLTFYTWVTSSKSIESLSIQLIVTCLYWCGPCKVKYRT